MPLQLKVAQKRLTSGRSEHKLHFQSVVFRRIARHGDHFFRPPLVYCELTVNSRTWEGAAMSHPLKPSKSMRQKYAEKMRAQGRFSSFNPTSAPAKPRKPLKKQSKARAREMRLYYEEKTEFLLRPENLVCAICRVLGVSPMAATEVHHSRGRIGRLLRDQRFWVGSCRSCREIPHSRPAWAREMGLLCKASEWNVYPRA